MKTPWLREKSMKPVDQNGEHLGRGRRSKLRNRCAGLPLTPVLLLPGEGTSNRSDPRGAHRGRTPASLSAWLRAERTVSSRRPRVGVVCESMKLAQRFNHSQTGMVAGRWFDAGRGLLPDRSGGRFRQDRCRAAGRTLTKWASAGDEMAPIRLRENPGGFVGEKVGRSYHPMSELQSQFTQNSKIYCMPHAIFAAGRKGE